MYSSVQMIKFLQGIFDFPAVEKIFIVHDIWNEDFAAASTRESFASRYEADIGRFRERYHNKHLRHRRVDPQQIPELKTHPSR